MDRTEELREKLLKILSEHGVFYIEFKPDKTKIKHDSERLVDEILALFSQESEAIRKDERERILKAVNAMKSQFTRGLPALQCVVDYIESLKEDKEG